MPWRRRASHADQAGDEGNALVQDPGSEARPGSEDVAPAVEPIGERADDNLVAGVARSRGGFMARLKGLLGRGDPEAATL